MDGGASFYIALAASAVGTAVSVDTQNKESRERQQILENEKQAHELAALAEENERLMLLREADDEILAGAGGVDPWASPSLIAARMFNFRATMDNIENLRYNLTSVESGIMARIGVLRSNRGARRTSGLFSILGTTASGLNQGAQIYG